MLKYGYIPPILNKIFCFLILSTLFSFGLFHGCVGDKITQKKIQQRTYA